MASIRITDYDEVKKLDNKLSELSKPEQFDAEVEIHGGEPFAVWAPAVNGSHVKKEQYFALLAERDAFEASAMALRDEWRASKKSNAFLKEQLAQLANFNPDWDMLEACRESWREVAAALKEAEANLEAKSLECRLIEQERKLFRIERTAHQQHAQELEKRVAELSELETQVKVWESAATKHLARAEEAEKRLATPVRLPGSFYPDGDIDLPLAVELAEAVEAIRTAGFTVEGDE